MQDLFQVGSTQQTQVKIEELDEDAYVMPAYNTREWDEYLWE